MRMDDSARAAALVTRSARTQAIRANPANENSDIALSPRARQVVVMRAGKSYDVLVDAKINFAPNHGLCRDVDAF
jgi:hypothetical protein